MLSKDLSQMIRQEGQQQEEKPEMQRLMARLKDKQFYIWFSDKHKDQARTSNSNTRGDCCFNHIIGLPTKNGQEKPLFDYEKMLYRSLTENAYLNSTMVSLPRADTMAEKERRRRQTAETTYSDTKNKHVAVLKAAGLGITEFMLRWIVWMCMRNDDLKNSQVVLFTGPRIELAISLINRMKDLFRSNGITFNDKETVLNINGVRIEAFPSHHADSARGLPNISIIFVDEFSFVPPHEIDNITDILLRNIPKSNPYLIVVSTPNRPGDPLDLIMKEPIEISVWKKIWLDWTYGISKIYDQAEIDKIKNSRSFEREFNLKFVGLEGNVFSQLSIDKAMELGKKYDYDINMWRQDVKTVIGIDPAFGSPSKFGIVIAQFIDQRIIIIYTEEYERPHFSNMITEIWDLKRKCGNVSNIIVDSANPEIVQALKREFKERYDEQYIRETLAHCRKHNIPPEDRMFIVPKSFAVEGKQMLEHCIALLDDNDGLVAIPNKHEKLIISLRSATAKEYRLDKNDTVHSDIFDAFRLAMSFFRFSK